MSAEGRNTLTQPDNTTSVSLPSTDQMVRALAVAMRDKALADARQSMKMVRQIERDYGLTPTTMNARDGQQR